ncbi:hypothetical protein J3998_08635, partial [Thiomicrorhabdus sp. 6S2-11]
QVRILGIYKNFATLFFTFFAKITKKFKNSANLSLIPTNSHLIHRVFHKTNPYDPLTHTFPNPEMQKAAFLIAAF